MWKGPLWAHFFSPRLLLLTSYSILLFSFSFKHFPSLHLLLLFSSPPPHSPSVVSLLNFHGNITYGDGGMEMGWECVGLTPRGAAPCLSSKRHKEAHKQADRQVVRQVSREGRQADNLLVVEGVLVVSFFGFCSWWRYKRLNLVFLRKVQQVSSHTSRRVLNLFKLYQSKSLRFVFSEPPNHTRY